ncbi:hypothetical protein Clacol_007246 [Clathrus columnatus]|uniref:Endopeptidase S2P n=1 Tax=Clathrus columnatus TaxID=1419009 RepID=A0AAV5AGZ1_9AGAM|nr:hypothetical protein Clacol_007246 [Clathrus columnatus]
MKIPKRLSSGSVAIKTKLKVRCSRYLYTLVLDDEQKADKLAQSLSPSVSGEVNGTRDSLWKGTIGDSTIDLRIVGFLLLRISTNFLTVKDQRPQNALTRSPFANRDGFAGKGYTYNTYLKFLLHFYTFGSLSAIIGQLFAIGVLWWSGFVVLQRYFHRFFVPEPTTGNFVKRGLTTLSTGLPEDTRNSIPQLIASDLFYPVLNCYLCSYSQVPGVNVPFSHLYPIMVALVLCTGIHELGHAIAASLENIPVTRWGYNLFAVIPTAFVEIIPPKDQLPNSRLRIASAGVFHNLMTVLLLFLLSSLQMGRFVLPLLGYKTLGSGMKVIDVAEVGVPYMEGYDLAPIDPQIF